MTESRKIKIKDSKVSDDWVSVEGPDEDGEYELETHALDDTVTLDRAGIARLHKFLGQLLAEPDPE